MFSLNRRLFCLIVWRGIQEVLQMEGCLTHPKSMALPSPFTLQCILTYWWPAPWPCVVLSDVEDPHHNVSFWLLETQMATLCKVLVLVLIQCIEWNKMFRLNAINLLHHGLFQNSVGICPHWSCTFKISNGKGIKVHR